MPADQAKGYTKMIDDLEQQLADITGMAEVSFIVQDPRGIME
jgi:glycine dehydrogenase